jgi:hypothetical protein
MCGIARGQRTHSKPLFRDFGGFIKLTIANVANNIIQAGKVIAHVAEYVLLHGFWQLHQLTGILRIASRYGEGGR